MTFWDPIPKDRQQHLSFVLLMAEAQGVTYFPSPSEVQDGFNSSALRFPSVSSLECFWPCAFSCQLSALIANEPPLPLCSGACPCLSCLAATRTSLSICLIIRTSSFILGTIQALQILLWWI